MQTVWLFRASIGECKVNRDGKPNLTSAEDEVQKRMPLLDFKLGQNQFVFVRYFALLVSQVELMLSLLCLGEGQFNMSDILVLPRLLRLVKFNSEWVIDTRCHVSCA